ncbi:MAG: hypothetical protein IPL12_08445 [Bacteroidetes bacterium]|nr:hypothetical protein [Bacteroidota bacterium]
MVTSFGNGLYVGNLDNCNAPTGLVATGITTTSATVSWTAIPGADSYKIMRKQVGGLI